MASISLCSPHDGAIRLQHVAELTGRSKTFYKVDAINLPTDDLQDLENL